jgi:hypothetical protein
MSEKNQARLISPYLKAGAFRRFFGKSRSNQRQPNHKTPAAPRPKWLFPAALVGVGVVVAGIVFALIQFSQREPYIPEVTGRPSAAIDQTVFDYGDVVNNSWVETTFHVKNVGDQSLIILGEPLVEVVEGCCPPRTSLSQRILAPGEEATVSMRFSMHAGMDGPHEFRVRVVTTDPENPEQQVVVRSNWLPA